ncbi:MAG: arginase [Spirochaetes bacterium]|nr:MAG: arginase [Spirochaetota bacterium]
MKKIRIIGIPMDLGQSRRGVDMGPSAMRYACLSDKLSSLGYEVEDIGNIRVDDRDSLHIRGNIEYADPIGRACALTYDAARKAVAEGYIPVFLGGDHSIAIGSVGGVTHDSECGVLWVDAHGDFNVPETSPNGNIHGMPVAVLTGYGIPQLVNLGRPGPKITPRDIVLFGIRDLDYDEKTLLKESGIKIFTMRDIDEKGIAHTAMDALKLLGRHRRLHVSLDMDVLDPADAPGVGTKARGGTTYREAHLLMEILADTNMVGSLDIVEINPILDHRNQTATLAVELAASLFGKRIDSNR